MKKFALLALLLSLGVSMVGCESKKKEAAPAAGAAPAADTGAAPAAEEKK